MRIDQGPGADSTALLRLPSPSEHAGRNREAIERLLATNGARLLVVSSVAGQLAILAEQDGTVIDEEVAVAGHASTRATSWSGCRCRDGGGGTPVQATSWSDPSTPFGGHPRSRWGPRMARRRERGRRPRLPVPTSSAG